MKNSIVILSVIASLFLTFSCSKDSFDNGFYCFGEAVSLKFKSSTSSENTRKIFYDIQYSGKNKNPISSVKWDFGDGTSENATDNKVTHVYKTSGIFSVKADITIMTSNGLCTSTMKESITVL